MHAGYSKENSHSVWENPNVVVDWLTMLVRIREVPGSYLEPEPGYPD
jgi:hypothetical protein